MNHRQHAQALRAKRMDPQDLPKFWRPKLTGDQVVTAKVIHWDLIDRITSGQAGRDDLWDWIETGYTYSQIMRLLVEDGTAFTDEAISALAEQLDIYMAVIGRFRTTGRVGFTGEQLCIAKAAASVMDALIEMDRHGIALRAALWSTEQMRGLRIA